MELHRDKGGRVQWGNSSYSLVSEDDSREGTEPRRCPLLSLPLDLCRKDGTFAFDYSVLCHPRLPAVEVFFSPYLDLVFVSFQLFFSYFKELVGKEVTVELKNDLAIRGTLHSVDQYLNIKLENIKVVDEGKYPHMYATVLSEGQWFGMSSSPRTVWTSISSMMRQGEKPVEVDFRN
ncbi:hypothetical protein ZIOFF_010753 [Zingiber officinale]|uniref:Sm domain-containing protein n=1 Tax=Zingiber officinale TaxID=94328 RepID=A0A8J5LZW8_ZINOF|nr:hypothetical protein ZIOFF_010753 [Zingiber officinale]